MSELMEIARRHVESLVEDLKGDEDFMPFLNILTHDRQIVYAGLAMPDSGAPRDGVADVMMALCATHRAAEAVFASTVWMVIRKADADGEWPDMEGIVPSEHPDRVETVFLASISGARLKGTTYSAPVIRENNTVRLGEWTDSEGVGMTGRFGDAIIAGMKFGEMFPPEMCEYIDAELAADRAQEVVTSLLRAISSARTGAFNN